jgi:predicted small integral membrane protein
MKNIPTGGLIRRSKLLIVLFVSFFGLLVVFGNLTDYSSNFQYVQHILSMDTTHQNSSLMYRSINLPILHHRIYWLMITLETLFTVCCLIGAYQLYKARNASSTEFHEAKKFVVAGFMVGIFIWYFCFQVIGGEWFVMWQSMEWNDLGTAERLAEFLMMALIFIALKIDD